MTAGRKRYSKKQISRASGIIDSLGSNIGIRPVRIHKRPITIIFTNARSDRCSRNIGISMRIPRHRNDATNRVNAPAMRLRKRDSD